MLYLCSPCIQVIAHNRKCGQIGCDGKLPEYRQSGHHSRYGNNACGWLCKRFSAETMNGQSSGAASMDQHLSSPETRRCFAPTMARTIAMLRPLCFARWDSYFTFGDIGAHAFRRAAPRHRGPPMADGWPNAGPRGIVHSQDAGGATAHMSGCSAQCGRCAHTIKRIMDERPGSVHANASMHRRRALFRAVALLAAGKAQIVGAKQRRVSGDS